MRLFGLVRELCNAVKGERRAQARRRMLIPVRLLTEKGERQAALRNISRGGASLAGHSLPPPGTRVTLIRGRGEVAGEMVWLGLDRGGLKFDAAQEDETLLAVGVPAAWGSAEISAKRP